MEYYVILNPVLYIKEYTKLNLWMSISLFTRPLPFMPIHYIILNKII